MINRKIKMAKELIKLAKLLIIGYKLVGYDILCKKIKDVFTAKKKDLKADYFCNISIDGRSNAINKTISFHANKKSISKNEIYPDNIKVDVKVNTDGNNCVIAATYQVNGKKQSFNPPYKMEYIGDDQDDDVSSGNNKLFKYFEKQFESFMTNNLEFQVYNLEEQRKQREKEEQQKQENQQKDNYCLDDHKRWSPGGYKENNPKRKPRTNNYGWNFSLEQQSQQRPDSRRTDVKPIRQEKSTKRNWDAIFGDQVDEQELKQFIKRTRGK